MLFFFFFNSNTITRDHEINAVAGGTRAPGYSCYPMVIIIIIISHSNAPGFSILKTFRTERTYKYKI